MNISKYRLQASVAIAVLLGVVATAPASAATINWTQWTSFTVGYPGSAGGTIGSLNVAFSGDVFDPSTTGYPSWGPLTTFSGGTVGNPPPASGGIIAQTGGNGASAITNTITFSSAVTNPVIAIWSLGQPGLTTEYDFGQTPIFQSGGPSNEYGGVPITITGNNVFGNEGNGTVQFNGVFTSLSWTNPVYENWYGFTVGV